MKSAGFHKGDLAQVQLGKMPKQGYLCAAFTSWGELVIRYYHRKKNGDIRLSTGAAGEVFQVFAPDAVMIFGRVARDEKGGVR
jgi:hypothetical protein